MVTRWKKKVHAILDQNTPKFSQSHSDFLSLFSWKQPQLSQHSHNIIPTNFSPRNRNTSHRSWRTKEEVLHARLVLSPTHTTHMQCITKRENGSKSTYLKYCSTSSQRRNNFTWVSWMRETLKMRAFQRSFLEELRVNEKSVPKDWFMSSKNLKTT